MISLPWKFLKEKLWRVVIQNKWLKDVMDSIQMANSTQISETGSGTRCKLNTQNGLVPKTPSMTKLESSSDTLS